MGCVYQNIYARYDNYHKKVEIKNQLYKKCVIEDGLPVLERIHHHRYQKSSISIENLIKVAHFHNSKNYYVRGCKEVLLKKPSTKTAIEELGLKSALYSSSSITACVEYISSDDGIREICDKNLVVET